MTIFYFDALAGAGKTYALAQYAHRLAKRGQKVLFIQPTKNLIDKTIRDELHELEPRYPIRAIHGDAGMVTQSVIGDIVVHFRNAVDDEGEILFVTHAAFLRVPYLERKDRWLLIMDEVPQVDMFEELVLPETHHLITPYLSLVAKGAAFGLLIENLEAAR